MVVTELEEEVTLPAQNRPKIIRLENPATQLFMLTIPVRLF